MFASTRTRRPGLSAWLRKCRANNAVGKLGFLKFPEASRGSIALPQPGWVAGFSGQQRYARIPPHELRRGFIFLLDPIAKSQYAWQPGGRIQAPIHARHFTGGEYDTP